MNRCPITYQECGARKYSRQGLRLLSPQLNEDLEFPFTAAEQLSLVGQYADKLSIGGIQPKLSVRLNISKHTLEPVEARGVFIVKPQHPVYPSLPEIEDLTMRLAALAGMDVPFHCLVYGSDNSLCYLVRRFDRYGRGKKYAVEDFSQLSGHNRDTKYDSSMEQLVPIIDSHCSFPLLEKVKLFRMTLFCFLVGNEDMHLKNFSLIRRPEKIELSPAYDLLNSTIVIRGKDELALPLKGKRSKLTRALLCDYYGSERLRLNQGVIETELQSLAQAYLGWGTVIDSSFLPEKMRESYKDLLDERSQRLFGSA
ncbi:MAG: HipA domain-containing protein [Chlamydiia bacterium]|nr:HipA domain-containing protein [Chlamydiia bacterium]